MRDYKPESLFTPCE